MTRDDLSGLCLLLTFLAGISILPLKAAETSEAGQLYDQALELKTKGDTRGALKLLDQALALDDKYYLAAIERGNIRFHLGDLKNSKLDYESALNSKSNEIRSKAHVGLADILYDNPTRTRQAIEKYRLACKVDPNNREALYSIVQAGFKYEQTIGHRVASEALVQLITLDPEYRDAYALWRDKILDKSDNELREVDHGLENFLSQRPDSANWWVDMAEDRFRLGQTESALESLNRLKAANPDFVSPDLYLTEAGCRLELDDSAGFQDCYQKAIDSAQKTGDFSRLLSEAETIFTPDENRSWQDLKDKDSRAAFFRTFWARVNPDQINPLNLRLVEHYRRLRHAQKNFRLMNPHSSVQSSREANLLLAYQGSQYQFDSEIFVGRSRDLGLDQRGLLYLRLGEPDKMDHDISMDNPMEIWHYGGAYFVFEKPPRVADYIFRPVGQDHAGNMMKAMEMQRFVDKSLHRAEDYYYAQFLADDGRSIDLEFYQDEKLQSGKVVPEAAAALYDTLWTEVKRKDSRVFRVPGEDNKLWLAVHRLDVPPGPYYYSLRMKGDGERWVTRGRIGLQPFVPEQLCFSAVLLGIEPPAGSESYERRQVRLIPRPSMKFKRGEQIKVYSEVYGLRPNQEGKRSYREWVDVIRMEDQSGKIGQITDKLSGLFTRGKAKADTKITQNFDRAPESAKGPVAETFLLDSSVLEPGKYRLVIEAQDDATTQWGEEAAVFEVTK